MKSSPGPRFVDPRDLMPAHDDPLPVPSLQLVDLVRHYLPSLSEARAQAVSAVWRERHGGRIHVAAFLDAVRTAAPEAIDEGGT
jgi:hypothetical protein